MFCAGIVRAVRFFLCWGLIVFSFAMFSLVIPSAISKFDRHLGDVAFRWTCPGPIVFGMVVFGWVYAGMTIMFALTVRKIARHFTSRAKTPGVA